MRLFRYHRTLALWLLLLWGTATVHCGLELDGLIGRAHHASISASSAPGDSDDSDPDGCAMIENGFFAADAHHLVLAQPLFALEFILPALDPALMAPALAPVAGRGEFRGLAPPELLPSWSFARRASPPARAPDSVS